MGRLENAMRRAAGEQAVPAAVDLPQQPAEDFADELPSEVGVPAGLETAPAVPVHP